MSNYWTSSDNIFIHKVDKGYKAKERKEGDGFHFSDLLDGPHRDKLARNLKIIFRIKINDSDPKGSHIAMTIRKNPGGDCYGIGLGGWKSYVSFFEVKNKYIYSVSSIGLSDRIQAGKGYKFEIVFKSNKIKELKCDGEIIFENMLLRNALLRGNYGLYAYDFTDGELEILEEEDLGLSCFVLHRIDLDSQSRINDIKKILDANGIKINEIIDSTSIVTYPGLMQSIMNKIIDVDFVISDFSEGELRPNVAYETGIAHSHNIPTIHLLNSYEGDIKGLSDLGGQYFIIKGDNNWEEKLKKDIKHILNAEKSTVNYLSLF
ncbi:MAG: hypothetical protein PHD29_00885 [bacterium]|nr:hypothetical protein [bacterium]